MNQLKRKIFLDLFITPSVMIPTLISSTLFLMGWGVEYTNLMFLGIVGLLGSAGFASYRFLFNFEQVADKVSIAFRNQKFNEWKNKLNQLNRKLVRTDGEEDENCLATLKTAYSELLEDIRENKLSQYITTNTSEEVEMWFEQCVEKLERSYELWDALKTSPETVKKDLTKKRKVLLEQVEKDVAQFVETVHRIRALRLKETVAGTASEIQRRLDLHLRIAEETQLELEKINNPNDLSRFEEFRKE